MALDLERARDYVATHGSDMEKARLAVLLGKPAEPPQAFLDLQQDDGGFPYDWIAGAPRSLQHTATSLRWLHDLGLDDHAVTAKAVAFLVNAQKSRGIWRESDDLRRYDLPLWMDPDATAADVYTTASCASALVPFPEGSLALDRAQAWLQSQQGRDGLLQGFKLHASAYAVPVFSETLGIEGRGIRRLVGGLGNVLRSDWAASTLVLLLRQMFDAGYGLRTEVVARAWTMLQAAQLADGSFAEEDEDTGSSAVTLDVMFVAHQLGYEIAPA